jgi:DNA-binding NarL/FixJ family response regulator
VVSGRDDPLTVSLARALGCDGFISKASPLTEIQNGLRALLAGDPVFPTSPGASPLAASIALLTAAQARVLAAAATGKLNKQIAYEMNLAEPTVKSHMSAIFKRLGVSNRTQAILALNGSG